MPRNTKLTAKKKKINRRGRRRQSFTRTNQPSRSPSPASLASNNSERNFSLNEGPPDDLHLERNSSPMHSRPSSPQHDDIPADISTSSLLATIPSSQGFVANDDDVEMAAVARIPVSEIIAMNQGQSTPLRVLPITPLSSGSSNKRTMKDRDIRTYFSQPSNLSTRSTTRSTPPPTVCTTQTPSSTSTLPQSTTFSVAAALSQHQDQIPKGPGRKQQKRLELTAGIDSGNSVPDVRFSRLMSDEHFTRIITNTICSSCRVGKFKVSYEGTGVGAYTVWVCVHCGHKFDTKFERLEVLPDEGCDQVQTITEPDIATTFMALRNDIGYQGHARFLGSIHLTPCSEQAFYNWASYVYRLHNLFYDNKMSEIRQVVRNVYINKYGFEEDENGLLPIMVSTDGTWKKRSRKGTGGDSMYCEVYVVEATLGFIFAYGAMEKCHTCHKSGNTKPELCPDESELFHGSSGDMEVHLTKKLFAQSIQLRVKYSTMICDGDSDSYNAVKDTYGLDSVTREHCVVHVGKLLPTHLYAKRDKTYTTHRTASGTTIKKWTFKEKVGDLGLSSYKIDKLGTQFQAVIKDTTLSIAEKQRYIMGIWKHHNDFPLNLKWEDAHVDCYDHDGKVSCPWKAAKLAGKPNPKPKTGIFCQWPLGGEDSNDLKGVFEFLSRTELLERCALGLSTNINESVHSKSHAMGSKNKILSLKRIRFLGQVNALQHNLGHNKGSFLVNLGTSESLLKVLRKDEEKALKSAKRPAKTRSRNLAKVQQAEHYGFGRFA